MNVPLVFWGKRPPSHRITCICRSEERKGVATGSESGQICLWDVYRDHDTEKIRVGMRAHCMCVLVYSIVYMYIHVCVCLYPHITNPLFLSCPLPLSLPPSLPLSIPSPPSLPPLPTSLPLSISLPPSLPLPPLSLPPSPPLHMQLRPRCLLFGGISAIKSLCFVRTFSGDRDRIASLSERG